MSRPPRPDAPGPAGDRVEPVRRPRRLDQHHAADLQEPGLRGRSTSGTTARSQEVVDAAIEEDVAGRRGVVVPGRPRRVLRVPRRVAARARRRARPGRRRRRRRHRARRDRAAARARRHDLLPRGRPADGPARDDQLRRRATSTSTSGTQRQVTADEVLSGDRVAIARAITGAEQGRLPDGRPATRCRDGGGQAHGPGARHHRHRRLRQVLPHRRAGPPASASTSRTSCGSPSSPSTRPGARAAARCSATGSG